MTRRVHARTLGALAGLIVAATLWAVAVTGGDLAAHVQCRARVPLVGIGGIVALLLSLAAGWWSWRAYTGLNRHPTSARSDLRRALVLLAGTGAGSALLFGMALALQALAGFMLSGCER
ncbi:MAG: hypothetical protein JO001_27375 [Alphaproteobacteria bacterium]|nr:hypothetical protein [Alphaproteobacteria bacterium]